MIRYLLAAMAVLILFIAGHEPVEAGERMTLQGLPTPPLLIDQTFNAPHMPDAETLKDMILTNIYNCSYVLGIAECPMEDTRVNFAILMMSDLDGAPVVMVPVESEVKIEKISDMPVEVSASPVRCKPPRPFFLKPATRGFEEICIVDGQAFRIGFRMFNYGLPT